MRTVPVNRLDLGGHNCLDSQGRVAERTFDPQPILDQRFPAPLAHQERHIRTALGQPPAEIAADPTGAENENPEIRHGRFCHCRLRAASRRGS
jgi:hypothetical protein